MLSDNIGECMKSEDSKHVNQEDAYIKAYELLEKLESRYVSQMEKNRLLASTWLLATLGTAVFIHIRGEKINLFGSGQDQLADNAMVAGIVCFFGAIGICLLWVIDTRVYRTLMAATWLFGMRMEKHIDGLIPVRHSISAYTNTERHGVVGIISYYYAIQVGLLLLLFVVLTGIGSTLFLSIDLVVFYIILVFYLCISAWIWLVNYCKKSNWRNLAKESPSWLIELKTQTKTTIDED